MMRVDQVSKFLVIGLAMVLSIALSEPSHAAGGSGGSGSAPAQSDDSRHRNLTSSSSYMPLPALVATVQSQRRARGLLQIEAGLEVHDPALRRRVDRFMPRLRNAYISTLTLYTGMYYEFGDIPDADRIAAMLQEATDLTLGESGAEVLLGMVIIHAD